MAFLQGAYEVTDESAIIGKELATARRELGDRKEALAIITAGLKKSPSETRLRDLYIELLIEEHEIDRALDVALEGERIDPTSWRLQRHIARLKRIKGEPVNVVRGYYEASIRSNKGFCDLYLEMRAYLFMSTQYLEADEAFACANEVATSGAERKNIRHYWKDADGIKAVFRGKVWNIRGGGAIVLAVPQNFEAFFLRSTNELFNLREGDQVRFNVGFNVHGGYAFILGKW